MEIVFAIVALVIATFFGGKMIGASNQKKKQDVKEIKDYNETRKKLDEIRPAADADAARSRLRDRRK